MSSPRIHRFDFNSLRDFRGPIVVNSIHSEEVEAVQPPPPPVFTLADIEAARLAAKKEGYDEGFLAGGLDAKSRFDQQTEHANELIKSISEILKAAHEDYRHTLTSETSHATALTLSVAKKVAGNALDARGEQAIATVIEECLPVIFSKPRLSIDLHPDIFERTVDRIETQLRTYGFEGEIQFRGNESLGKSDVILNWGSGELGRSASHLWQEIESIIGRITPETTLSQTSNIENNSTGA